jgi:hypothetical protein
MFFIMGLLEQQILGIVGLQIEIKCIFSLIGVLANLHRCILQINNLE